MKKGKKPKKAKKVDVDSNSVDDEVKLNLPIASDETGSVEIIDTNSHTVTAGTVEFNKEINVLETVKSSMRINHVTLPSIAGSRISTLEPTNIAQIRRSIMN